MTNNIYIFIIILILIIYYLITKNGKKQEKDKFFNTANLNDDKMELKDYIESKTDEFNKQYLDNLKKCNSSIEVAKFDKDNIKVNEMNFEMRQLLNKISIIDKEIQQSENKQDFEGKDLNQYIEELKEEKNKLNKEKEELQKRIDNEQFGKYRFLKMKDTDDCKFKLNEKELSDNMDDFNLKVDKLIKKTENNKYNFNKEIENSDKNMNTFLENIKEQDELLYNYHIQNVYGKVENKFLKDKMIIEDNIATHEQFTNTYLDDSHYFKKYSVLPYQYKNFNFIKFEIKKEVIIDNQKLNFYLDTKIENQKQKNEEISNKDLIYYDLDILKKNILSNVRVDNQKTDLQVISEQINTLNSNLLKEYFNSENNIITSTPSNVVNIKVIYTLEIYFNPQVNKKHKTSLYIDYLINYLEQIIFRIDIQKGKDTYKLQINIMNLIKKDVLSQELKSYKHIFESIIENYYHNQKDRIYNEFVLKLDEFLTQLKNKKDILYNDTFEKQNKEELDYNNIYNQMIDGLKVEILKYYFDNKQIKENNINMNLINNPEENNNVFIIKYMLSKPNYNENFDFINDKSTIVNGFKFTIIDVLQSNIQAESNIVTKDIYDVLKDIGFKTNNTLILYLTNENYNKTYNIKSEHIFDKVSYGDKYELLKEEKGFHLYTFYDMYGNSLLSLKNIN